MRARCVESGSRMKLRRQLIIDFYLGTLLHVVLKPFVILAGRLMRRDHDLMKCRSITVIKMLGGGSLAIAYPALMAMKQASGVRQLRLLTTPAVKPFAEVLGVFDEITVIRVGSLLEMCRDSIVAIRRYFLCDAIVDLEIHSRLTTVLALLICARNRVGFYTLDAFWRRNLSTHLIFCNIASGTYHFYDQIAALFGGKVRDFSYYQHEFRQSIGAAGNLAPDGTLRIAIAPCSSDLGRERMLRANEWAEILQKRLGCHSHLHVNISLYASPADKDTLDGIAAAILRACPQVVVQNRAGQTALLESIQEIAGMDELICIDSSLMHFSRLSGLLTRSYWGPTDPQTRLRPWPNGRDEIHYVKLPCSPCVHLTNGAPCEGDNICMQLSVNPNLVIPRNRPMLIAHERATRIARSAAP